jgi:hypothetical protein
MEKDGFGFAFEEDSGMVASVGEKILRQINPPARMTRAAG